MDDYVNYLKLQKVKEASGPESKEEIIGKVFDCVLSDPWILDSLGLPDSNNSTRVLLLKSGADVETYKRLDEEATLYSYIKDNNSKGIELEFIGRDLSGWPDMLVKMFREWETKYLQEENKAKPSLNYG